MSNTTAKGTNGGNIIKVNLTTIDTTIHSPNRLIHPIAIKCE